MQQKNFVCNIRETETKSNEQSEIRTFVFCFLNRIPMAIRHNFLWTFANMSRLIILSLVLMTKPGGIRCPKNYKPFPWAQSISVSLFTTHFSQWFVWIPIPLPRLVRRGGVKAECSSKEIFWVWCTVHFRNLKTHKIYTPSKSSRNIYGNFLHYSLLMLDLHKRHDIPVAISYFGTRSAHFKISIVILDTDWDVHAYRRKLIAHIIGSTLYWSNFCPIFRPSFKCRQEVLFERWRNYHISK